MARLIPLLYGELGPERTEFFEWAYGEWIKARNELIMEEGYSGELAAYRRYLAAERQFLIALGVKP